jgi:hypothetical protein
MVLRQANLLSLAIVFTGFMSCAAQAGDHYFSCATPGGNYQLNEEGELRSGDKLLKYRKLRQITIRQQGGVCAAKNGSKYKWDSHTYLIELSTHDNDHDVKLMFLCEEGGSGVPANVTDCVTRTTLDKELRPAYRNRAK